MPAEPVRYSAELADRILDLLAEGKTLTAVCKLDGMPRAFTVNRWVKDNKEGFADRYRDARHAGGCVWVDDHKDEMDDCDTEAKARILDSKTRALKALIAVVAPTLTIEPPAPPQRHVIEWDFGEAPPLPTGRIVQRPPVIDLQPERVQHDRHDHP